MTSTPRTSPLLLALTPEANASRASGSGSATTKSKRAFAESIPAPPKLASHCCWWWWWCCQVLGSRVKVKGRTRVLCERVIVIGNGVQVLPVHLPCSPRPRLPGHTLRERD
eukprot:1452653-Rhodomonas_salina.1